jgi:putative membrane protein
VQAAAEGPSWRLRTGPLLVTAFTSGSFGVLIPVVAGASQVVDDVLGVEDAQRLLPDTVGEVALLAGAVVGAAYALSVLGTIVAFAGFAVRREGERLRIRRGVIERREASGARRAHPRGADHREPAARAVRPRPGPRRDRRLRRRGLDRADAAAARAPPRRPRPARPARPRARGALFEELEPAPRRALRRRLIGPVLVALAAGVAATVAAGAIGALAFALVLPAVALGLAQHRATGWRLSDERIVLRSRRLARSTAVADTHRLQTVGTAASVLQRRARLATLAVHVSSGRRLAVEDIEASTAGELRDRLAAAAVG